MKSHSTLRPIILSTLLALIGLAAQPIQPVYAWALDCSNAANLAAMQIDQVQCESLESIYDNLGGAGWTDNTGWGTATDVDTWFGVTRVGTNVTEISMFNNNLSGNIHVIDLTSLANVEVINLGRNQIGGDIGALNLAGLSNLQELILSENNIGGTIDSLNLVGLSNLERIGLDNNQLGGDIAGLNLSGLVNLQRLRLNNNQIGGNIDGLTLTGLSNLDTLMLDFNDLGGDIAGLNLSGLSNLSLLWVDHNQIGGNIDGLNLSGLSNLEDFGLGSNQIGGNIDGLNLAGLTRLRNLSLGLNQIGGDIAGLNLSGLNNLYTLSLFSNQITGDPSGMTVIPASLRVLQLDHNQMIGTVPDLTGTTIASPGGSLRLCSNVAINPSGVPAIDTFAQNHDTSGWTAVSGCGLVNLVANAACNGDNLEVTITAGDLPFDITGTGPMLPQNGVGLATHTLTGPDTWTGVTITETAGDTESANLGDFTCAAATAPEIDVQRPASIADGGNDAVGAQPVGSMTLTYTIDNTAGTADLTITAGGVTATNLTNVSGFTVNTALPLTVAAGTTSTLQIQFNIDASGAFSFDLEIDNNDADENPYDIAVSGTGTSNLTASAACNGNDLDVTITAGDGPFDITGTGASLPLNGVGIATHTLTGPDSWTGVTVTETAGDTESANLGDYTCPPPVVVGGVSSGGGGGSASSCNLAIDVEADHEVVAPGDRVIWTVRVTNSGSAECQSVQTYGTMPGEFSITGITPSRGDLTWDGSQYYRVELGTLAVNEQVTVSIDSLLQGGAGLVLPEGAAGQSAGTQICLTGYITDPVNDTDCVMLFPDTLPSTGGEPVSQSQNWVWVVAGLLIVGISAYALKRQAVGGMT